MKWLLLLTILSGYSGSSTVAANFDSKDVCEAAAKSHEEASVSAASRALCAALRWLALRFISFALCAPSIGSSIRASTL